MAMIGDLVGLSLRLLFVLCLRLRLTEVERKNALYGGTRSREAVAFSGLVWVSPFSDQGLLHAKPYSASRDTV
jgi:hypothetical protein